MSNFEKPKKYAVSSGQNNMIKIFDAISGQLVRSVPVQGVIMSQPIVVENQIYCEVKQNNQAFMKYFSLPLGSLIRSIPINR